MDQCNTNRSNMYTYNRHVFYTLYVVIAWQSNSEFNSVVDYSNLLIHKFNPKAQEHPNQGTQFNVLSLSTCAL